ncbi:MAG: hypothetical protein K2W82_15880 [Candidatus Obscuribacterales bacterium]|nr:hypothetical protein [Candidatus Obscuribacterales bacterium]
MLVQRSKLTYILLILAALATSVSTLPFANAQYTPTGQGETPVHNKQNYCKNYRKEGSREENSAYTKATPMPSGEIKTGANLPAPSNAPGNIAEKSLTRGQSKLTSYSAVGGQPGPSSAGPHTGYVPAWQDSGSKSGMSNVSFKNAYSVDNAVDSTPPSGSVAPDTESEDSDAASLGTIQAGEAALAPGASVEKAKAEQQACNAQNADNQGQCCQQNCGSAFFMMTQSLINVANENAAIPTSTYIPFKLYPQAIWMVQKMYKSCYIPMAVLLLLPGALLTNLKGMIGFNLLNSRDEDTVSPFAGIFRSMMAIFLIPCTQLIVSYCIDIGNAVTAPVANQVRLQLLLAWVKEQAFSSNPALSSGMLQNILPQAMQGKLANSLSSATSQEKESNLTVTLQNFFNTVNSFMSQGLQILNGFQIVMMCYLFLLGPIAAALFAWPSGIGRDLFKKAFSSWLDGVIVLSLWKFWWCIVLLCMAIRLQTGVINPADQYEMYYFTAFMGILVMVPFQPFEFRPGEIVSHVLEKAQQQAGGGGGGGGGGSGGRNSGMSSSGTTGGSVTGTNLSSGGTSSVPGARESGSSGGNGGQEGGSSRSLDQPQAQPMNQPKSVPSAPPPGTGKGIFKAKQDLET